MERNSQNNNSNKKAEIDLLEVFINIWKHRKFIIIFTTAFIVLGIAYALLKQPLYESSTRLYKTEGEGGSMSRLQGLASQFGLGGSIGSNELFNINDLVNSRSIRTQLLYKKWNTEKFQDSVNLITYWEIEEETKAAEKHAGLETLKEFIGVNTDEETQLTTITVLMQEPELAADVANHIVYLIEDYIQNKQKMQTRENLTYIQKRLDSVKVELSRAEEALKSFRKRNRMTALSPELQTQQMRLQRELTIKQEVFLVLQKELEMTKIELVKETPVINVLDEAEAPVLRAQPKRKLVVIISLFLGLFLSLFALITWYLWTYLRDEMKARNVNTKLF